MFINIQARVIAFAKNPKVQSVVRHAVTAAIAVAVPFVAVHGVVGLVSGVGAAMVARAVWAAVRPEVVADVKNVVAADVVPEIPQTPAGSVGA